MPIPKELTRMEMEALMDAYDEYIQDANDEDRYEEGWKPVCLNEYYDNEWVEVCRDMWIDNLSDDEKRTLEYLEKRAVRCPMCGSRNICALGYNGEALYQEVECHDCGAMWQDLHEIIDMEIQDRGDR